jgi:hypothetical protein
MRAPHLFLFFASLVTEGDDPTARRRKPGSEEAFNADSGKHKEQD